MVGAAYDGVVCLKKDRPLRVHDPGVHIRAPFFRHSAKLFGVYQFYRMGLDSSAALDRLGQLHALVCPRPVFAVLLIKHVLLCFRNDRVGRPLRADPRLRH